MTMISATSKPGSIDVLRRIVEIALVAILYFLAARLGLLLAFEHKNVSPVWPPSGVAVAMLLFFRFRCWPGIAVGAMLANYTTGLTLQTSCIIGIGNTLEALAAAYLLDITGSFRASFSRIQDVLLLVFAAAASSTIAATIGVFSLFLSHEVPLNEAALTWLTWWLGDSMGIVVFGCAISTWLVRPETSAWVTRAGTVWRVAETGAFVGTLLLISSFIISNVGQEYKFVVFPVLIWAALRFGQRGASTAITFISAFAVWATIHWYGPFVKHSQEQSLMFLQAFMAVVAITTYQLAAAVSEHKTVSDALRRANEFRDRVLESAIMGVSVLDLDGKVTLANHCLAGLLDSKIDEIVGRPFTDFVPPDELQHFMESFNPGIVQGISVHGVETHLVLPDGSRIAVSCGWSPLRDAGKIIGLVGTVEDITERKRMENQLLQSQRLESIGRLAGGIAHDFNNLLTAILGCAELGEEELPPDHPAQAMLKDIRQAADRAANLTKQLLAFARRQIIKPTVVNANEIIGSLEQMIVRLIPENVALLTLPQDDLHNFQVDPGQFEQILINLVVNARDAMPDGGRITIETQNVILDREYARHQNDVTPGEYVMVSVSDTGTGLDDAIRTHIFEPFYTTKEKGVGTGLGLATVYGVVKQAGGHIQVESERGAGTTFKIFVPRAKSTEQVRPPSLAAPRTMHGDETVLLVEDESSVRTLAASTLKGFGYRMLVAESGDEALRIANGHSGKIALLLTDVIMPNMSGRQLADRLTAERPNTKVLYSSGYAEDEIAHHGMLEPGIAFLAKPFTPSALAQKVREVLDGSSSSESAVVSAKSLHELDDTRAAEQPPTAA